MPWQPLARIAFAVATFPFTATETADLPLEIGDELYIFEETSDGQWLRGYLVAPPSLLAGLTSKKGQTLEARVFSGIFPRSCVEVREVLGEVSDPSLEHDDTLSLSGAGNRSSSTQPDGDSAKGGLTVDDKKRASELPLHGTTVSTARKSRRWSRLSRPVKRDPDAPRPPAPVPLLKVGDETPTSENEPLIDEIASCLREWNSKNLHELLLSRNYSKLGRLSQLVSSLNHARQQFLHSVLTSHELHQLRERTVWNLVRGNKLCGGEVIVRDPAAGGRMLTGEDTVIKLTKLQTSMSLLDEPPAPVVEQASLHHLLVNVKALVRACPEDTWLVMYLATKELEDPLQPISESFVVHVSRATLDTLSVNDQQMATLFTNISPLDSGEGSAAPKHLYLVVKLRIAQQVVAAPPPSRSESVRPRGHSSHKDDKPGTPTGSTKGPRRSLMWGSTSRGSRVQIARNASTPKLETTSELADEGYGLDRGMSADGPPGSGHSVTSADVLVNGRVMGEWTVGAGVLRLNGSLRGQDQDTEHVINLWAPSARESRHEPGDGWLDVIKEVLDSDTGFYVKARKAERLHLTTRCFDADDADVLVKETPTRLAGICQTPKMGFSGAPTKPRSDIYFTIEGASIVRQTQLSRFGGSASPMPLIPGSNLQVSVEVRRPTGQCIENCIFPSSNSHGVTNWKTTVVAKGESWNQTIRLQLDVEDVRTAQVIMFLADLPSSPFALAHMPLWEDEAFIRDGPHAMLLYRLDENTALPGTPDGSDGGYLSLKWGASGDGTEVVGTLASIAVRTYLCSTLFSQDRAVLNLINWRTRPKEETPTLLKQIVFSPDVEIVKMLSQILDAIFQILVEAQGDVGLEDLVFSALVSVLSAVHDRRFTLGPMVDHYAEESFYYPAATGGLVRSFTALLTHPTQAESSRKLNATFKVARHIFKFIMRARSQQHEQEVAGGDLTSPTTGFNRHVRAIFKGLDAMMRNSSPLLVGSQTLAVQHFHTWLPELAGILNAEEILHTAIDFMDSCAEVTGKLVLYKLVLIINYSKLKIFSHPEQQSALSANTARWISPHWGYAATVTEHWKDQVRLCCSILAAQVDHLGPEIPDYIPKIVDSYLLILTNSRKPKSRLSLLFPTQYPFPSKPLPRETIFDEALIELSAVLSALSTSPSGMQLELADNDLTILLENILRVHMSIMQGDIFPSDWLSIHVYHYKSTMQTLRYLSTILLENFLPDPDDADRFNTDLWRMFFCTLLRLVGSPSLALETFPEQKRRAVWKIAGDVRELGAALLCQMWEAIGWETTPDEQDRFGLAKTGGYQVQYVPTLVGPIVELCLSAHEGLRKMAVEVLQTMIVSEWTLGEDLSVIQTEMIESLDKFFKTQPLTESILQKLFITELLARFKPLSHREDEPLYPAVLRLTQTVSELMDLLVAVHGDEATGGASALINRLRLMEFLRDMQKVEIFIRYVHQLATLHAARQNFTEAGLALRLHADLYDWNPTRNVPALIEPDFPAQSNFERKERIYFDMIKYFEDGEAWSSAITAYKELQEQYENNVFDFAKLARTQRAIATVYEIIAKSDRLTRRYYKVAFKGLGFNVSIRDKEFIYEGVASKKSTAFMDRMQEQYPTAQIVTSGEIDDFEGQYLLVSAVVPYRSPDHVVYQRARVPHHTREFLLSTHPNSFAITTKRDVSGPATEHSSSKVVYETEESFPTILRRSEIIHTREVTLSAKETAIERIVRKTQEMLAVEKRLADGDEGVAQLLLDAVKLSVSPESQSGVWHYRKLMTEPSEEDEEIPLDAQENAIHMALIDHAMMLKRCLATFAKSQLAILVNTHADLYQMFQTTYAPEIAIFNPPQPSAAPVILSPTPSPTWRKGSLGVVPFTNPRNSGGEDDAIEAVNTVRPVSLRQGKGARLSLLGGRKNINASQRSLVDASIVSVGSGITQHDTTLTSNGHTATTGISNLETSAAGQQIQGGDMMLAGQHQEFPQRKRSQQDSVAESESNTDNQHTPKTSSKDTSHSARRGLFRHKAEDTSRHYDDHDKSPAKVSTKVGEGLKRASTDLGIRHLGPSGTEMGYPTPGSAEAAPRKMGMKKRLSMFRLGKKVNKSSSALVGVEEE